MKLVRLLVLALLCLSPVLAAEDGGRSEAQAPAAASEVAPPLLMPEPIALTSCTAQLNCPNGGSVSCNGQTSCTVHSNYVTCDGNTFPCLSSCFPPGGCADPDGYCACKAAGGGGPGCALAHCV